MKHLLYACALMAVFAAPARAQSQDTVLMSAERAARSWLVRLDRGQLDSAWLQVAGGMRSITTYEAWATSLRAARSVLPVRPVRTLLRAEHLVEMFGGPSVLMTFRVDNGNLREIIVLVRTRTGWSVAGYGVPIPPQP